MAVNMGQFADFRARHGQKMVMHPVKMLADDVQVGIRQQMVDVGDPPGDGIFDGNHGQPRTAVMHGGEGVFEGAAGQGLHVAPRLAAGKMRISAGHALEGDGGSGRSHG